MRIRMNVRSALLTLALVLGALTIRVGAETSQTLKTFRGGEKASAADVNNNFEIVTEMAEENSARISDLVVSSGRGYKTFLAASFSANNFDVRNIALGLAFLKPSSLDEARLVFPCPRDYLSADVRLTILFSVIHLGEEDGHEVDFSVHASSYKFAEAEAGVGGSAIAAPVDISGSLYGTTYHKQEFIVPAEFLADEVWRFQIKRDLVDETASTYQGNVLVHSVDIEYART